MGVAEILFRSLVITCKPGDGATHNPCLKILGIDLQHLLGVDLGSLHIALAEIPLGGGEQNLGILWRSLDG